MILIALILSSISGLFVVGGSRDCDQENCSHPRLKRSHEQDDSVYFDMPGGRRKISPIFTREYFHEYLDHIMCDKGTTTFNIPVEHEHALSATFKYYTVEQSDFDACSEFCRSLEGTMLQHISCRKVIPFSQDDNWGCSNTLFFYTYRKCNSQSMSVYIDRAMTLEIHAKDNIYFVKYCDYSGRRETGSDSSTSKPSETCNIVGNQPSNTGEELLRHLIITAVVIGILVVIAVVVAVVIVLLWRRKSRAANRKEAAAVVVTEDRKRFKNNYKHSSINGSQSPRDGQCSGAPSCSVCHQNQHTGIEDPVNIAIDLPEGSMDGKQVDVTVQNDSGNDDSHY